MAARKKEKKKVRRKQMGPKAKRITDLDRETAIVMDRLGIELKSFRSEFPSRQTVANDIYRKFGTNILGVVIRYGGDRLGSIIDGGVAAGTRGRTPLAEVHDFQPIFVVDPSGRDILLKASVTAIIARLVDRMYPRRKKP